MVLVEQLSQLEAEEDGEGKEEDGPAMDQAGVRTNTVVQTSLVLRVPLKLWKDAPRSSPLLDCLPSSVLFVQDIGFESPLKHTRMELTFPLTALALRDIVALVAILLSIGWVGYTCYLAFVYPYLFSPLRNLPGPRVSVPHIDFVLRTH